MSKLVWVGPVVLTLYLAGWSFYARSRWFTLYLLACFVGFCAGLVLWPWPEQGRDLWWSAWACYFFVTPFVKVWMQRRHEKEDHYVT